jgi:hypothetical protein
MLTTPPTSETVFLKASSPKVLLQQSAADYVLNLPDNFWSPDFGQQNDETGAYEFSFTIWEKHYQARKEAMREYLHRELSEGCTILESFSHNRPTADFTNPNLGGISDTLWNIKGIRRLDLHGTITPLTQTFVDSHMNADYLSEHLTNRIFGFGMRVATWLEPSISSQ